MSVLDMAYETRELVMARLGHDLLGGPDDDVLTEKPLSRFVMGILYPDVTGGTVVSADDVGTQQHSGLVLEDDVENDVEAETGGTAPDGVVDPAVSMSRARYPRSMGMTLAAGDEAGAALHITMSAARYELEGETHWRVRDLPDLPRTVRLHPPRLEKTEVADGLQLVVFTRPARDGIIAVTLTLLNTLTAVQGDKDSACWFRPTLGASAVETRLRERPASVGTGIDELELASQRLLFRDVRSFAVGHGCAVAWDGTTPERITTTFLPRHELLLSEAAGGDTLDLSMDALAHDDSFDVLARLIADYRQWITGLGPRASTEGLTPKDTITLQRHIREANEAADRMAAGLELLRTDDHVARAFRLTNLAMAQQRSRQHHHRSGGRGDPPSTSAAAWRPFQIAFILTNLRGLADPHHRDRGIADLLWFPTGGGKTEAYLGIIGITILLRRLRDPGAAGVSVLMRYTLRLLTLQQYQRATGLICALEKIRSDRLPDTGPISIGLWVGGASTPNTIDDARRALDKARKPGAADLDDDRSDPVQLRQCPWCGHALDYRNYAVIDKTSMRVACGEPTCAFRQGLPVHIVDDDVYANRPSLVIGTVDKFAMMPWKRQVGSLLGVDSGTHPSGTTFHHPPPDLIVQDELHLISGPLGTVVGLYETAVDAITGADAPAKIVASTATIRRARDQVRAVFARDTRQFPPPGLSLTDSYFAVEAPRRTKASREYVGAMAPGASHTTLMVRVYASLLQSASAVKKSDPSGDLFWTLLGYFNSLRVLGGAYIQVLDDVPDQMKVIAGRRHETVRPVGDIREMTSRKRSAEIPQELQILERRRGEPDAADVVLATNMISVGVDVDRLGLMVVMGQPQTSSEYIQATSRVGRSMPGLVITLYNSRRSRDLSHYENFAAYHRGLYRHVEATGATPFAPRARDRALHAVLVSLARHRIPAAGPGEAAGDVTVWQDELEALVDVVLARARATRGPDLECPDDESDATIRAELEALIDNWTDPPTRLSHYAGWFGRHKGALLVDASRAIGKEQAPLRLPPEQPPWPTLTSMRDVDAESSVYLIHRRRRSRRES